MVSPADTWGQGPLEASFFYLFGLGGIEPSSFGEEVFLVALRLFLAALLSTLIGSLILLVILIRNERARDNARLVARGVEEDGA